jgi:hypothetical protein
MTTRIEARLYFTLRRLPVSSWRRWLVALAVTARLMTLNSVGHAQEKRKSQEPPAETALAQPSTPVAASAQVEPTPNPKALPIEADGLTKTSVPTETATTLAPTQAATTSTPATPTIAPLPTESASAAVPAFPAPTPLLGATPKSTDVRPEMIHAAAMSKASQHSLTYGIGLDLGVSGILPDTGLLLTMRPIRWIHIQLGGGYNVISYAIRGGVTLLGPEWLPLSLTGEGGHYFDGDANKAVSWVSGQSEEIASLKKVGYDYMNALVGMTSQGRRLSFYLRGGVTWMRTTVRNFQQSVNQATGLDFVVSDPKVSYRGPAVKFGMIVFL